MKLSWYVLGSVLTCSGAISHAIITRPQFYNASIYLTSAKFNVLILSNFAFMLALLCARVIQAIFLGELRGFEVESLVENGKYAVTETCLALTTFREEINFEVVLLFCTLLFFKCFHWLLISRVDHTARHENTPIMHHIRLLSFAGFLFILDLSLVLIILRIVLVSVGPSVLLFFAFEFSILLVSVVCTSLKYVVVATEARMTTPWTGKAVLIFFIEISSDLTRLFLYSAFFIIVCSHFGLPIHLVRELFVTFHTLKTRLSKFLRYRRLLQNLNNRFSDATPEQILNADQCIICREDMQMAKVLPCNHLFHIHCLRIWLERSNTCPTCRAVIPDDRRRSASRPNGVSSNIAARAQQDSSSSSAPPRPSAASLAGAPTGLSGAPEALNHAATLSLPSALPAMSMHNHFPHLPQMLLIPGAPSVSSLLPVPLQAPASSSDLFAYSVLLQHHSLVLRKQISLQTSVLHSLETSMVELQELQARCAAQMNEQVALAAQHATSPATSDDEDQKDTE